MTTPYRSGNRPGHHPDMPVWRVVLLHVNGSHSEPLVAAPTPEDASQRVYGIGLEPIAAVLGVARYHEHGAHVPPAGRKPR